MSNDKMRSEFEAWYEQSLIPTKHQHLAYIVWQAALSQRGPTQYSDVISDGGFDVREQTTQVSQTIGKEFGSNDHLLNKPYTPKVNLTDSQLNQIKMALDKSDPAQVTQVQQVSHDAIVNGTGFGIVKDGHLQHVNRDDIYLPIEEIQTQVSQELSGWKIVWPNSTDSVGQDYFIGVDNYERKDVKVSLGAVAIPLFTSPPDYEALKAGNEHLQEQLAEFANVGVDCERTTLEELDVKDKKIEALKLRVAELESEVRTKHEYAMQMLGERDAPKVAYQRRESIIFPHKPFNR